MRRDGVDVRPNIMDGSEDSILLIKGFDAVFGFGLAPFHMFELIIRALHYIGSIHDLYIRFVYII